jgi:transcriptional antiterminator RfaH
MQAQWFVIQSKPRQEMKACQELQKQGYEVFLPTIEVEKILGGKRIQKEEPLFSRYLFIQLNQTNSDWGPLRSTRGVSGGLVRFGSTIPSLSDKQLSAIKNWVAQLPKKDCFLPGQFVQMIAGPFSGMQGVFEKLVKTPDGQERAVILFEILNKTQKIDSYLGGFR